MSTAVQLFRIPPDQNVSAPDPQHWTQRSFLLSFTVISLHGSFIHLFYAVLSFTIHSFIHLLPYSCCCLGCSAERGGETEAEQQCGPGCSARQEQHSFFIFLARLGSGSTILTYISEDPDTLFWLTFRRIRIHYFDFDFGGFGIRIHYSDLHVGGSGSTILTYISEDPDPLFWHTIGGSWSTILTYISEDPDPLFLLTFRRIRIHYSDLHVGGFGSSILTYILEDPDPLFWLTFLMIRSLTMKSWIPPVSLVICCLYIFKGGLIFAPQFRNEPITYVTFPGNIFPVKKLQKYLVSKGEWRPYWIRFSHSLKDV